MRTYFSIGEISKMTGLTINALRHYDKIGLVKPKIVNGKTNYRYYDQNQLFLFDIINFAKKIDLPLEELAKILNSNDMNTFKDFLEKMKQETTKKIESLRQNLLDIDNIQEDITAGEYLVDIKDLYQRNIPERDIVMSLSLPQTTNNYLIKQKENLETEIRNNRLVTTFESGSVYRIIDNQVKQISIFKGVVLEFATDSKNVTRIPNGNYLCVTYTNKNRDTIWKKFLQTLGDLNIKDPLIIEENLVNDIFNNDNRAYELQVYLGEETSE